METPPFLDRCPFAGGAKQSRAQPGPSPVDRVAPSITIIQPSEVHTGLSDDPAAELDHLFERLVR